MNHEPGELSLKRTLASSDGRSPGCAEDPERGPPELALAHTHTPLPLALEKTLTPLPLDLDKTRTPPPDLFPDDEHAASPLLAATMLSNGDGSRHAMPRPDDEDRRAKELVKARLFRSKARPVKIGRFTILDRLGEGGMGVVYTAYDDQLDRKIAVKVLRGEATRQDSMGRTRLLREAQAMARLSHPNIVTVHEVGDHEDQIYIAMEFVRGQSLDSWLRGKPLKPWRAVLDTFIRAGRGLEAAHRADIIHRDFKPHNVLVGDDGVVKVLDFGLARAVEHAGSEELSATPESGAYNQRSDGTEGNSLLDVPLTRTGAIMGTPAYMAPEQHEGRVATAQSDQFSFCVSLYEGLYGLHPFDCTTLGALIAGVTTGRLREPPTGGKIPAWLRRVLVRGLAVEPERRYPSMTALLADLGRDPAVARKRWLTTAALTGFVGSAGFGAAALMPAAAPVCEGIDAELAGVWDAARSEAVGQAIAATKVAYADDTWARVQPQLDAYAAEWLAMRGEACETHHAARQSDQLFDLRSACLDQRRDSMRALVDILASADAGVVEKAVLTAAVPPPDDPALREQVALARATLARAKAHEDAGQYAQGIGVVEELLTRPELAAYKPLAAETRLRQGSLNLQAGAGDAAHANLDLALRLAVASGHDVVAAQAASRDLFVQAELQRRALEALAVAPMAEALVERGGDELVRAEFLNNRGIAQMNGGDLRGSVESLQAALEIKRRELGEEHPEVAFTLSNLAFAELQELRVEESVVHFEAVVGLIKRTLGAHHPAAASMQYNLGYALRLQGRPSEAIDRLQRALTGFEENGIVGGPLLVSQLELGFAELALGHREQADKRFAAAEALLGAEDRKSAATLHEGRGDLAQANGDLVRARTEHETAVQLRTDLYGADHFDTAYGEQRFGAMLLRAGRADEALDHLNTALAIREKSLPPTSPAIAETLEQIGQAQLLRKDAAAARAALERALQIRQAVLPPTSPDLARVRQHLDAARALAG
jgi:tetratricopeptide (TPR) repeat protein/predicted Ser/Thr protein kinase